MKEITKIESSTDTYKINKNLKLNTVNEGEPTDNVLVHGSDNEVKSIPRSEFGGGAQNLDQTLAIGNTATDKTALFKNISGDINTIISKDSISISSANNDDGTEIRGSMFKNKIEFSKTGYLEENLKEINFFADANQLYIRNFRYMGPDTPYKVSGAGINSEKVFFAINENYTLHVSPFFLRFGYDDRITSGALQIGVVGGAPTSKFFRAEFRPNDGIIAYEENLKTINNQSIVGAGNIDIKVNTDDITLQKAVDGGHTAIKYSPNRLNYNVLSVSADNSGTFLGMESRYNNGSSTDISYLRLNDGKVVLSQINGAPGWINSLSFETATSTSSVIVPNETGTLATREYILGRTVENATTVNLTASDLNTAYPTAVMPFKVIAKSMVGGSLIYEKTSTGWIQYSITAVP